MSETYCQLAEYTFAYLLDCIKSISLLKTDFIEAHPLHLRKTITINIWPNFHFKWKISPSKKVRLNAWQRISLRGFLLRVSGLLGFPDASRWFSLNGETPLPDHEKFLFLGQFKRQPAHRGVVPLSHQQAECWHGFEAVMCLLIHTRPAPQANILWHLNLQGWLSRRVFLLLFFLSLEA